MAELVPEVVEWNRTLIGAPAGHPLADPRSSVYVGDVADLIRQSAGGIRRHSDGRRQRARSARPPRERLAVQRRRPASHARRAAPARRARGLVGQPGSRLQQAAAAGRLRRATSTSCARIAPARDRGTLFGSRRSQSAAGKESHRDHATTIGSLAPMALGVIRRLTSLADGKTRADCEREYTPQRAQEGKDVIWAPTRRRRWSCACSRWRRSRPPTRSTTSAPATARSPIAAAKQFGATAVGIEYDADLVKHARCLAEAEGVARRASRSFKATSSRPTSATRPS